MLLHKSVEFDSRVRREASALARAGQEVIVLELAMVGSDHIPARPDESTPPDGSTPNGSTPDGSVLLDGFARCSVLPPAWLRRRLPFHLYRAAFLWSFVAGIRRVRPDIVHAHDAAMLLPGIIGARLTGARLVYDSHELATSVPYREPLWAAFVAGIERLVVPRCAAVITVSDGIARRLRERYRLPRTPCVVRNVSALTPDGRPGLRERLGIASDTLLVLHQGAPAPARGCEVLIEAVAGLPGVHLAFLGDPEPGYGAALRGHIAARGMDERVGLLGSVALDDLLAHTAEADVGVTLLQDTCLNHRLALPNKLFEYIAAGVPVVAAALPETQRLVKHHGVGWCAQPDDPAAVAAALRLALRDGRDPGLRERIGRAAEELSWEREQGRLLELYESLSTGAERRRDGKILPIAHTAP
jgi:glycosyltransferase involved in cell wall biosynthesis